MHAKNCAYRSVKPENVVLDKNGHVHFIDFDLVKKLDTPADRMTTFCGTPEYLSPELLTENGYGIASDWWGLGVLIFEMIVGLPPFYATS